MLNNLNRKTLLELVTRAHDALESPEDLSEEEVLELIEDLAEVQSKLEDSVGESNADDEEEDSEIPEDG